jgi:hypothetical protein
MSKKRQISKDNIVGSENPTKKLRFIDLTQEEVVFVLKEKYASCKRPGKFSSKLSSNEKLEYFGDYLLSYFENWNAYETVIKEKEGYKRYFYRFQPDLSHYDTIPADDDGNPGVLPNSFFKAYLGLMHYFLTHEQNSTRFDFKWTGPCTRIELYCALSHACISTPNGDPGTCLPYDGEWECLEDCIQYYLGTRCRNPEELRKLVGGALVLTAPEDLLHCKPVNSSDPYMVFNMRTG